jgi:hypothetical protein
MKMAILINGQWHEVWGLMSHTIDHIVSPQEPESIHTGDTLPDTVVQLTKGMPMRDGYTEAQLRAAFNKVKNKRNWRTRINKVIEATPEEQRVIAAAISFFTGSSCNFEGLPAGQVRVTSAGYYASVKSYSEWS